MLDSKRIGLVHIAWSRLKLSEEDYRAILRRTAGVDSAKQLDQVTFHNVMMEFQRLGFRSSWKKHSGGYRAGMATPAQIALMEALWQEYRGEAGLDGFHYWLERFHKVSDARFVTSRKADAVITALKAMARRKKVA